MDLRKCIIIRKFDTDLYDDEDLELCEEYAVAIEAGEILTGFATVYRERNFNMCIAVNPDRKRNLIEREVPASMRSIGGGSMSHNYLRKPGFFIVDFDGNFNFPVGAGKAVFNCLARNFFPYTS